MMKIAMGISLNFRVEFASGDEAERIQTAAVDGIVIRATCFFALLTLVSLVYLNIGAPLQSVKGC